MGRVYPVHCEFRAASADGALPLHGDKLRRRKADGRRDEKARVGLSQGRRRGDRLRLFRWCTANEGMDVRDAADFVACAGELLTEMLCMREKNPSIDRAEILRLGTVLSRCGVMLQVNTGVKHIFGLLAVESLPTA